MYMYQILIGMCIIVRTAAGNLLGTSSGLSLLRGGESTSSASSTSSEVVSTFHLAHDFVQLLDIHPELILCFVSIGIIIFCRILHCAYLENLWIKKSKRFLPHFHINM